MSDAERVPNVILRDLNREMHERISKSIYAMTGIVDHPLDKFQVAVGALSSAIGISAGFMSGAVGHRFDPYDVAVSLIEMLRDAQTTEQRKAMEEKLRNMMRAP